jgi:hypothetical protein
MQIYYQGLEAYKGILLGGWEVADVRQQLLEAAIFHALWFDTWRSLVRVQSLDQDETVELMTTMVVSVAEQQ